MAIQKVCIDSLGNIGSLACSKGNPFVDAVSLLITTSDFEFATMAAFATEATMKTGIKAGKVFPLHEIVEYEDQSEDSKYYESPSDAAKAGVFSVTVVDKSPVLTKL